MNKDQKTHILSLVMVVGLITSIALHYRYGIYDQLGYPKNTFLYLPEARFTDFYDVLRDGHTLNPYLEYKSAQYPLLAIFGFLFSLIPNPHNTFIQYQVYLCVIGLIFLYFSARFLKLEKWYISALPIFSITFLSYPFLFTMDRGNFESLVFVLLLAFLFFFVRKRYLISTIFLSLAIAMKIYPAILLLLFIPEKKYREIGVCLGMVVGLTLISMLVFKGGLVANIEFLLKGSNISLNLVFSDFTSFGNNVVQRGVSLFTLAKIFFQETGWMPTISNDVFTIAYWVIASILGVSICLYVVFIEKEDWKRIALLVFAMLLLPPLSGDYKLLHIYLPLFLFINSKESSRFDIFYLLLFALLFIPKDYIYLANVVSENRLNDISISVVINILAMLANSILIMISGYKQWRMKFKLKTQNPQMESF